MTLESWYLMDVYIVLQRKILRCYAIKWEDKYFFTSAPMCLYQFTKESCLAYPLLETPSICNDENLLSHIIRDITFQAYIINQQVSE